MSGYENLALKRETKARLGEFGKKGETWDELVDRLLNELELNRKKLELPAQ